MYTFDRTRMAYVRLAYMWAKRNIDFDWSHVHKNSDGRKFERGVVHVQVWKQNKDGSFSRQSDDARSMSNAEMKKYGPILKAYCPTVKLR